MDWTEYDDSAGRVAASLRRGEVLDHILWRMGQEVLAPRMMQAALDALMNALGAEGAAVIDLRGEEGPVLVHRAGGGGDRSADRATGVAREGERTDGRPLPRMDGRSWSRPATHGSAPMPAWRCGARPAHAAGTARTCC